MVEMVFLLLRQKRRMLASCVLLASVTRALQNSPPCGTTPKPTRAHDVLRRLTTTPRRAAVRDDAELTLLERYVIRGRGTEPAFSSPLDKEKRNGTFACKACGTPLFDSATKFDSGTGWPSFWDAARGAVTRRREVSWPLVVLVAALTFAPAVAERALPSPFVLLLFGLIVRFYAVREEVACATCDAHLGHVFPDGPRETTGLRYCMNGVSLTFLPSDDDGDDDVVRGEPTSSES